MNPSTKKKFDTNLLNVLVCPLTKCNLIYDDKKNILISSKAKLAYRIENGIPILIPEKAKKI
tara:strand:- start:329 stop:514 length:186 start_codon:yes stop_codon:yes gene_type:complete